MHWYNNLKFNELLIDFAFLFYLCMILTCGPVILCFHRNLLRIRDRALLLCLYLIGYCIKWFHLYVLSIQSIRIFAFFFCFQTLLLRQSFLVNLHINNAHKKVFAGRDSTQIKLLLDFSRQNYDFYRVSLTICTI